MAPSTLLDFPAIKPASDKTGVGVMDDFELDIREELSKQSMPVMGTVTCTCATDCSTCHNSGCNTCLSTCSYNWGC
jgi:hypothetical protein